MYEILSNCVHKKLKIHLIGKNYKTTVTIIKKVFNYLTRFNKKIPQQNKLLFD